MMPTTLLKYTKSNQGFSLIELLVVMALVGILAGIGGSIFILVNITNSRAIALSKLQTQNSQTIEVMERAIRSAGQATTLNPGTSGCLSGTTQCLQLRIIADSIEYRLNGGCYYTYYAWYKPTTTVNGRLVRYYRDQGLNVCPALANSYDLFDGDIYAGTSIEPASGSSNVFSVIVGDDNIDQVKISAILLQGVGWKRGSGPDNRVNIPMQSVTGLRNY